MRGRGAAHRAAPWRACGRGCPRGENTRADSCRSRSCPAAAVDLRADPLPVRVLELLAEAAFPVSDERRRLLQTAALPAGQHHPQSSLGQGPKRGLLLARETLHALEEVVGYLDRRLHQPIVCDMATHINGSTAVNGGMGDVSYPLRGRSPTCARTSNTRPPRSPRSAMLLPGLHLAMRRSASCAFAGVVPSMASSRSLGRRPACRAGLPRYSCSIRTHGCGSQHVRACFSGTSWGSVPVQPRITRPA